MEESVRWVSKAEAEAEEELEVSQAILTGRLP